VYVHHISVRPAHQRRGCGDALLAAIRDIARAEGIAKIALDVWSFNATAKAFFAAQGFAAENERLSMEVALMQPARRV